MFGPLGRAKNQRTNFFQQAQNRGKTWNGEVKKEEGGGGRMGKEDDIKDKCLLHSCVHVVCRGV